jgi:ferredoxin
MKLVVNRLLCDGNGLCVKKVPELLVLDQSDRLRVLRESFGEQELPRVQQAVKLCPKAALSIAE